jgi:hypothetical protein
LAMYSECEPERIRRRWSRWFSHRVTTPSPVNACEMQSASRLVAGMADGYCERINNCF